MGARKQRDGSTHVSRERLAAVAADRGSVQRAVHEALTLG